MVNDLLPFENLCLVFAFLHLQACGFRSTRIVRMKNARIALQSTHLQIHGVFVDLALIFVIAFRVVEHDINITHEMIDRLVLLSLLLSLCNVRSYDHVGLLSSNLGRVLATYLDLLNCNWLFDLDIVLRHGNLVW